MAGAAAMNHPSMTSRGKQITMLVAVLIALALPKHVDCGAPGRECSHLGVFRQMCTPYEVEPLGFYLLEKALDRDVGFAYSTGERCR